MYIIMCMYRYISIRLDLKSINFKGFFVLFFPLSMLFFVANRDIMINNHMHDYDVFFKVFEAIIDVVISLKTIYYQ